MSKKPKTTVISAGVRSLSTPANQNQNLTPEQAAMG